MLTDPIKKYVYIGDWKTGVSHGYGEMTFNGAYACGTWVRGVLEGIAFVSMPNGDTFRGMFNAGEPLKGLYRFTTRSITYMGEFKDWFPHTSTRPVAVAICSSPTHAYGFDGHFERGKRGKTGVLVRNPQEGGTKFTFAYLGEWLDDMPNGSGVLELPVLGRCSGRWNNGLVPEEGIFRYGNGDEFVGRFKSGRRSGRGTCRFANKDAFTGEWEDDEPVSGTYTWANGDKYVGRFKDVRRAPPPYLLPPPPRAHALCSGCRTGPASTRSCRARSTRASSWRACATASAR
jgi:hypothetical protein